MANGTQKPQKTLAPEELLQTAIETVHSSVKKKTTERLDSGQDPAQILSDLQNTLQSGKVGEKGKIKGLLPAIIEASQGQGFNPLGQKQRNITPTEQSTLLKNILAIQKSLQAVPGEAVEAKKAQEKLTTGAAPVAEREAEISGRVAGVKGAAQAKVEDLGKAQKTATSTFRFAQQFGRSLNELRKFDPDIEKEGFGGFLKRRKAGIAEKLDLLPETSALLIRIKPLANGMAREVEGGRVTDQDRQIYADAFANALENPGTTNTRLLSSSMIDIVDKGATDKLIPQLKQLAELDVDIFNDVISQLLIEHPDLVEDIYGEGARIKE